MEKTIMEFEDCFSNSAETYRQYRPQYPQDLYKYLRAVSQAHETVWDCATGNGQAAVDLVNIFDTVIATDASKQQIDNAIKSPRIIYQVAKAEHTDIASHSIDLIVVAEALHWFNLRKFYQEVFRVIKPRGIIAFWSYGNCSISNSVNSVIRHYQNSILKDFWPAEANKVNVAHYPIPGNFTSIYAPNFRMQADWNYEQLSGYLSSWSAVNPFHEKHGYHPIQNIEKSLRAAWGDKEKNLQINWPMQLKVAQLNNKYPPY